jgi:1-acyl-sn-glycerol-3-phosphate acyltransferase
MILYKIFFRFRVYGRENVPPQGGVIIAANHLSYLDPQLIGIAIRRRATYMARSSLFTIPLVGKFVASFSFPVHRENPRPSTIKEAVNRLKSGELIVMFPEGSRSANGDLTGGKRGVATIASLSGATIIPALIAGTDRALPVGAKFIRPAKVTITFGSPLSAGSSESDRDFRKRITQDIMEEIKKLKDFKRFQSEK